MRIRCYWIFIFAIFSSISLISCLKTTEPDPVPLLKIGLLSGPGGFYDAGYNQNILDGFQRAAKDLPLYCQSLECIASSDFETNINYFIANNFDLIITVSFYEAEATIKAAKQNPQTDFMIIDFQVDTPLPNLLCTVFDVDQAAFPCGFLAAWWAWKQKPVDPVAGFVAGPEQSGIRQFSVSFTNGVSYFNNLYAKNVGTKGCYASSFSDTLQGAALADSLIRQNAAVIFACAGATGNGALYKAKEAGKWGIGVDVDQYYSIPSVGPVLLSSCMKKLDNIVYQVLENYSNADFPGGTTIRGALNNSGVALAPFHDFDSEIPDSIKTAINTIQSGITTGTIKTGWPE
jgi:basic membrane protein A